MFSRRHFLIVVLLLLIGLFAEHARSEGHGLAHASEKDSELTIYFRKISGTRLLRTTPGGGAVSDNIYHALYVWDDYYAEQAFVLTSLGLHLHFDAHILSGTSASRIEIEIRRNGNIEFVTTIYELPPGFTGEKQIDILSDIEVYPTITFNQGDELGFHFRDVENLSPCLFLYNADVGRDDSHFIMVCQRPGYGILELSPTEIDLTLLQGASTDTSLELSNAGGQVIFYTMSLPQGTQTLSYDDQTPAQAWSISDQYGQDLFNVRFTAAQSCTLKSAQFLFSPDGSSGSPDLRVYVWDDSTGFPGAKRDSAQIPYESLSFSPDWQTVDFTDKSLFFQAHRDFHIGYTCISHSPGDALGLFSDDGLPVGNQRRSSGLWGQSWRTMYDRHDVDANFMIRADINYGAAPAWVSWGSYVPFVPPGHIIQTNLSLDASGLSSGVYRTGVVIKNDSPDRCLILPVTLRVGQTPVDEDVTGSAVVPSLLCGNYPNPFNTATCISYLVGSTISGQESQPVRLAIYNVLGQRVRRLIDDLQKPGSYSLWWDGRDEMGEEVTSGVYLCRLVVGDFHQVRKMLLLR